MAKKHDSYDVFRSPVSRISGGSTGKTRSYAAEGQLAYAPVTELLRVDPFRPRLSNLDPVGLIELVRNEQDIDR